MKTYITKYNSKSIIQSMDLSSINVENEIFKINFKWFSDYDVQQLLAFKLLYSNPEEFFKIYKKKEVSIDTKSWVFEGVSPAYHNSTSCEKLNSDYLNIKIPEKIKAQGDAKVEEFRNWVKENLHLIDNKRDFLDRIKIKFVLPEDPNIDFKKNGGYIFQQNVNLELIETTLQNLIQSANSFYNKNDKNKNILDAYGSNSYWHLKNNTFNVWPPLKFNSTEVKKVLTVFEESYKSPLKYNLQEYYRIKYNPELEFKGQLLKQLGFNHCKSCADKHPELGENPSVLIDKTLSDQEIIKYVLELEKLISRNSFQNIYSEIIPIKIEKSLELPDRNIVTLFQLFVTKSCDNTLGLKSLFSEVLNSKDEEVYYEKRYSKIQIPKHVETLEPINRMLNKYPKARTYRIINSKPVLSDSDEILLNNRVKSLQDLIKDFNRIQYEGKDYFVRYFFSKTSRGDIFRT